MLAPIVAVLFFLTLIAVSVAYVAILRIARVLYRRLCEARKRHFEPHVLFLLQDPRRVEPLARTRLLFDRRILEGLLLTQAAELKGADRANMTRVFERLGYVDSTIRKLESHRWWIRLEAAAKLGTMRSQQGVRHLVWAARDPVEDVRLAAVRSLGQMNNPEGVRVLLELVEKRGSWTGARVLEVVAGLGHVARAEVSGRLQQTSSPRSRLLLVQLAGLLRDEESVEHLVAALSDSDLEIRISAARALGQIGDPVAATDLITLLEDEKAEVRAQAAKSLGLLQNRAALSALRGLLSDDSWQVRYNAANALYVLGSPGIRVLSAASKSAIEAQRNIAAQVLAEKEMGL